LQKVYWVERNHFWTAAKNFPWLLLAIVPVMTLVRYLVQGYSVLKGVGELNEFTKQTSLPLVISTVVKAYMDMLVKLPAMMSKRYRFRKVHRIGNMEMFRLIWKYHLPVREIIGMNKR
jgi:hypothetical protein